MYILDCLKVGSNVYSSIDHSPGGKPNTPSHPVTAGHVADGQRGWGHYLRYWLWIRAGNIAGCLVFRTSEWPGFEWNFNTLH